MKGPILHVQFHHQSCWRDRVQELGTRERGGQRLAPEREGARNWHWREMGQETCTRERGGQRLAPEKEVT